MKDMDNDLKCSDFEHLLLKKESDNLTESEAALLRRHLESCERCGAFKNVVSELHRAMSVPSKGGLIPDREIYRRAVMKMKEKSRKRALKASNFWQSILGILRYRIPLYQAAMGIALFVFMFLSLDQFNLSEDYTEERISESFQGKGVIVDTVDVLRDIFKIDAGKVGRNAKEDSFLTQFIYTIM